MEREVPNRWFWAGLAANCAAPLLPLGAVIPVASAVALIWHARRLSWKQMVAATVVPPLVLAMADADAAHGALSLLTMVTGLGIMIYRLVRFALSQLRPKPQTGAHQAPNGDVVDPTPPASGAAGEPATAAQPDNITPEEGAEPVQPLEPKKLERFAVVQVGSESSEVPIPAPPTGVPLPASMRVFAKGKPRKVPFLPDAVIVHNPSTDYWHTGFLRESRPYITRQRTVETPFVPFNAYWPLFSLMEPRQLSWYLYWRGAWEQGEILQTTDTYLHALTFEFLNLEYEPDAYTAYEKLSKLYRDYQEDHPAWVARLPTWLGDFAWELGLDHQAADWYAMSRWTRPYVAQISQVDRTLHPYLETRALIDQSHYKPTSYYHKYHSELLELFDYHLHALDELCEARRKKPLIQVLNAGRKLKAPFHHTFYREALVGRTVLMRPFYRINLGHASEKLADLLCRLENMHRISKGNKSLRQELADAPKVVRQYLDAIRPQFAPPVKGQPAAAIKPQQGSVVHLDTAEAARLVKESLQTEAFLAQLMGSEENDDHVTGKSTAADRKPAVDQAGTATTGFDMDSLFRTQPASLEGNFADFWAQLPSGAKTFLTHFGARAVIARREAAQLAKQQGFMIAALVDEINQLAMDQIGDGVLLETDENLEMDEFHPALVQVLAKGE